MLQKQTTDGGPVDQIFSGGQTGVDRAALDAALAAGVDIGGWCPRGRRAEDGRIPECYRLKETGSRSYAVRTEWNVRDSDGTLIIANDEISSGTKLTVDMARRHQKPLRIVRLKRRNGQSLFDDGNPGVCSPASVVDWLAEHRIRILNVAGPRGSSDPDIYSAARAFVTAVLTSAPQAENHG